MEQTLWITPKAQQQVTQAGLSLSKILKSQWDNVWGNCFFVSLDGLPLLFTTQIPLENGATLLLKTCVPLGAARVYTLLMPGEDEGVPLGQPCGEPIQVVLDEKDRDWELETAGPEYQDKEGTWYVFWKPTADADWKE